jgi:hypothetical protein
MMAARKWDRLEKQVTEHGYDIFAGYGGLTNGLKVS